MKVGKGFSPGIQNAQGAQSGVRSCQPYAFAQRGCIMRVNYKIQNRGPAQHPSAAVSNIDKPSTPPKYLGINPTEPWMSRALMQVHDPLGRTLPPTILGVTQQTFSISHVRKVL